MEGRYNALNVFHPILQLNSPMLHYQMIFKKNCIRRDPSGAHKDYSCLTDSKSARNAQPNANRGRFCPSELTSEKTPKVSAFVPTPGNLIVFGWWQKRINGTGGRTRLSKDVWRMLRPWTNTALPSQESRHRQEALLQHLPGNCFLRTKPFLSICKVVPMIPLVCGARDSSGGLLAATAHRRSALTLGIKVSENSR